MPRFYEIKLFSVICYTSLIVFSFVAYAGGRIFPLGLVIVLIPFIAELVISVYYIKLSLENKQIHFLCFSAIIFAAVFFGGTAVDIYETKNTREILMDAGNLIEAYKKNNNLEYLMENDIDNMMIPEKIRVIVNDGAYRIFFKDGIYSSETKEVFFRPGP